VAGFENCSDSVFETGQFYTDSPPGTASHPVRAVLVREIVATPQNGKHKEYVRYAAHCLEIVPRVPDQEYRSIQREMAAEWLKLADAIIHPLGPTKSK
jgi:hypothetical protein